MRNVIKVRDGRHKLQLYHQEMKDMFLNHVDNAGKRGVDPGFYLMKAKEHADALKRL